MVILLLCRRLIQTVSMEKPMVLVLYEKIIITMEESERLKPDYLEVAKIIW